jgi:hypothetical protein
MSDTLTLTGQLTISPDSTSDGDLLGDFAIRAPLNDSMTLLRKESATVAVPATTELGVPQPDVVNIDAVSPIDVLLIRTTVPCQVLLTTSYGEPVQEVYVDSLLLLIAENNPITGISIGSMTSAGTARITMGSTTAAA